MVKQKDAVFNAVCQVKGVTSFSGAVTLDKTERQSVMQALKVGFENGTIEYTKDTSDGKLNAYISGLVSNWLRKDSRLNGNTTYVPSNPGSRTGNGDDALKAMRSLLAVTADEDAKAEIQKEIDKRLSELKPKPNINVGALPEHLRHLAGSTPAVEQSADVSASTAAEQA